MPFRLLLRSEERLSDAAIWRGLLERNTPDFKSRALLLRITLADQYRGFPPRRWLLDDFLRGMLFLGEPLA